MTKKAQKIKCLFGFHDWRYSKGAAGKIRQCRVCFLLQHKARRLFLQRQDKDGWYTTVTQFDHMIYEEGESKASKESQAEK